MKQNPPFFMVMAGIRLWLLAFWLCWVVILSGCSPVEYLEENETILRSVKLSSDSKSINPSNYRMFVRQEPNSRWFNLFKVPLGIYCLSGKDSTKSVNRVIRRVGEAPVVFSPDMTAYSAHSLTMAMRGKGYLGAWVEIDTTVKNRHVDLHYRLHPGMRKYVKKISYRFDNKEIGDFVLSDSVHSVLREGMPLDMSILGMEQKRIVRLLRDNGYYKINKEYISFQADTLYDWGGVHLILDFSRPVGVDTLSDYVRHTFRRVNIYENVRLPDTVWANNLRPGISLYYDKKRKISTRTYDSRLHLRPDSLYREQVVQNTYSSFNGIGALDYSSIRFEEIPENPSLLDCSVYVRTGKPNSVSLELEGTNTSGDLGAAVVMSYSNNNVFRGGENFLVQARGAYEAITGLEGYNNQNYIEYSIEGRLKFPTLLFPGMGVASLRNFKATSEVGIMYESQDRPEFHRRALVGDWGYRWSRHGQPNIRHHFDLFSINYVFMPWISDTFRKEYLEGDDPHYAVLRYSYEDLLIMKMGYTFIYNSNTGMGASGLYHTNGSQFRFSVETAGNLLQGISKITKASKNENNQYKCFDIAYSQYAKFDLDYIKSFVVNDRNSIAFHVGLGVALPYGNSDILPYEKRYFSGGANSVRGWSVRELGPGSYTGKDGKVDFINQTGNMKLDLSLEYRTRLFGKLHGAFFVDAGNIWNTRNYPDQPGGQFKFDTFYKQIAVSYGIGLRINLDYFVLRFDGGMKAVNPSVLSGPGHFPIFHPKFSRDFTFHFAVGMPF